MAGLKQVQRQTGVALWRQIADRIREAISSGAYDETAMVPPETILAQQFGVNRHTVRSALAALAQEGIVRAVQGRGTLIERKERLNFPITKRTRFSAGIGDQAREMRGLLLDEAKEEASSEIARWLGLKSGEEVIRLETLRHADRRPVSKATSWFPAIRFAGIGQAYRKHESITKAFAELGLSDYIRATTEVTAAHASAADMADLELTPGAILLITKAMNTDLDGVPVQYSISRFAADRVQFTIEN
ncbi:GntR family phosphonate transport system transcriptional regulator [Rhizobium leguminosarum]|uniref:GntR family phosphonate transport system transcriptional regulator n=1 Tax=Rhizobium leguminosarum TaxID=384 RepID=A0AAE2SZH8_RHILE|nr:MULTISPECIES: phosphonate metabolism transcriptional regulator PhnF [Rhizobium]MBB4293410.1 GntR family phosphonate transport system transcriptional regulator [Rhizobium leguminosarum]MBB4295979.1 GntR family phosphonate transport system transcriptional regulator [Rhizobium leguminosarum]MBB4311328.1 GntR family phosphonate transport system transcriptional regulator [Rhizobium leguminosarum]MBB4420204.1 GntR family phosphonate transport system transcriptional regulator [Rhizobium leguminosar